MVIISIIVLIFSIFGLLASNTDPNRNSFVPFLGLILPVILFIALLLVIYWLFNKSWLSIIPMLAIVINYNYIFSMVQLNPFSGRRYDKINSNIKIATYNIHGFNYIFNEVSVNYIADYLAGEGVDILCMQEFMPPEILNMEEVKSAFDFLPYSSIHKDSQDEIGLAIFSKYPITNSAKIHFALTSNGALWADINLPGGKVVRVINAHLQTTGMNRVHYSNIESSIDLMGKNFKQRAIQANIIKSFTDTTKVPVILCGDFNDTPSSYVYKKAKGNLIDGFKEAGSGIGSTFMHKANLIRIDYIMYSKELKGVRYYSNSLKWSDHNPVLTELEYRN
ncbi:MAG: endonuclease/exonuclease/phosphatase family protein [Bacteroidales bacterium]